MQTGSVGVRVNEDIAAGALPVSQSDVNELCLKIASGSDVVGPDNTCCSFSRNDLLPDQA
ncbi:hypothetical protein MPC4_350011 [Methylocella tundrae]|uniref:Uncharacterized protein n=1 Tax=Methylocella tundrae TaxID=227605 RepID=A0A8B6M9X7_METTU|nr:hypothetical protein MPC1_8540002 [Methylocella tundrae]VTZ51305.1 hypothetical protein MPC4_350011 [Methylocella tundrae]